MIINSLAFAILGLLMREPQSGYEMSKKLEVIWAAKLSQIYPQLSKLTKKGYVTKERVFQSGKPDKIIYHVTDEGLKVLKEWLEEEPSAPVLRDEFLSKVLSLWLTDKDTAISMFQKRKAMFKDKYIQYQNELAALKGDYSNEIQDITSMHFSRYILFKRRKIAFEDEIKWCDWVLSILETEKFKRY